MFDGTGTGGAIELIRHSNDHLDPRDIVDRLLQSPQCPGKRVSTVDDRVRHEGQHPAAERPLNERRIDIRDLIAEARRGSGAAIMQFIGMKHMALSRQTIPSRAPVPECLDARQGDADRIGVVAVRRKRLADEPRFETLYPRAAATDRDASFAVDRTLAQAFKTVLAALK